MNSELYLIKLLSFFATCRYRNTYKHNLCLEMLREGYHKSFAELFALIKQQNEERTKAGPESMIWSQVQLENEPEKLSTLKRYLTQAEAALRKGKVLICVSLKTTFPSWFYSPYWNCQVFSDRKNLKLIRQDYKWHEIVRKTQMTGIKNYLYFENTINGSRVTQLSPKKNEVLLNN